MSKSALGRGLAELQQQPHVSRGVQTIVGGVRETSTVLDDSWPLIRAALLAGDAALLVLSALIAWRSAGAMTLLEAFACSMAVIVGACLAIVAFTLPMLRRASLGDEEDGVNTQLPPSNQLGKVGAQFD